MPTDNKYGKITIEGDPIPEDEPVVVFRGRDSTLVDVLADYRVFCEYAGSPQKHLDLIGETKEKIRAWQDANSERVQMPASASYTPPQEDADGSA